MLMLHQSSNKGGMSGMDMVDKVIVPAGGTVRFAPGGYHLMCENPTAEDESGQPRSACCSSCRTAVRSPRVLS